MNVLPIKKLFYKASVLYIIKNNLTFKTEHGHNTRQLSNIKVPTMHKKLTQSTYLYIGPNIYNILPLEIKHINSFKILKKKKFTLAITRSKYRPTHNKRIGLLHYLSYKLYDFSNYC